jgi:hypothetical protein
VSKSYNLFYPVIHCIAPLQGGFGHALANAKIAYENGADGIFLIGHRLPCGELLTIYNQVRKQHPDRWIGINFLDIGADTSWLKLMRYVEMAKGLSGLWMDALPAADSTNELQKKLDLFGGVAFKYINPDQSGRELAQECARAEKLVQFITTSGSKTGEPPSVEKLETMRNLLSPFKGLAVASGVDASNVESMLPHADTFLVASSITAKRRDLGNQEYLVPEKVLELAKIIHV